MLFRSTFFDRGVKMHSSIFLLNDQQQIVSPLRIAIQSRSKSMVDSVLKHRPQDLDGSIGFNKVSPLHEAIALAASDVVKALLEAGANPLCEDKRGLSPLEAAVMAPSWRVSDAQSGAMCKAILEHTPRDCWSLRSFTHRGLKDHNMPNRPETFKLLKIEIGRAHV